MIDAELAPALSHGTQVAGGGGRRASATPARSCSQNDGGGPALRIGLAPRLVTCARLVALAVGGFLLPWCAVLGATLPSSARAQHWWLAWVGLDGGEAAMAFATAALLARRDVRASLTAAAGAALLLADAWFDICTSANGADRLMAIAEAAFAEVPLAVAAAWLAVRLLRDVGKPIDARARLVVVINDPRHRGHSIRSVLPGRAAITPFCGEPTSNFKGEIVTAQATAGQTTIGVDGILQPVH